MIVQSNSLEKGMNLLTSCHKFCHNTSDSSVLRWVIEKSIDEWALRKFSFKKYKCQH